MRAITSTLYIFLLIPLLQIEAADERPNVVFIMADDLGYGDLSCYGGWIETPHIDSIAKNGLRLTDYHSNGNVCSPTRAALMTGLYQQKAGILNVRNNRQDCSFIFTKKLRHSFKRDRVYIPNIAGNVFDCLRMTIVRCVKSMVHR